jgi:hypothetical protein
MCLVESKGAVTRQQQIRAATAVVAHARGRTEKSCWRACVRVDSEERRRHVDQEETEERWEPGNSAEHERDSVHGRWEGGQRGIIGGAGAVGD